MSLILEALKKSEAERRLGRAPDLLTPTATAEPERRPWLWLWGAVFGLAAVLVLVLVLWARSALQAPVVPEPVAATNPPATQTPAPVVPEPSATAAEPPVPPRAAPPRRTPAEAIANVPVPQDPDFAGTERESMAVPASAIPLPPPAPPTQPAGIPSPQPREHAIAPPPQLPPPTVSTSAPAPQPALEALQHLTTLPAAQREGLPPLRLSMHVYDPDPAARFVLIDGKRYRQGDAIAPGILVDAIRPDGVAIARGQQRFLISRP